MIEASARRNPDATARVDGKLSLTYAQLDARAETLALRYRASRRRRHKGRNKPSLAGDGGRAGAGL